ncbi:MAG: hypothetical protein KJ069_29820 [Anaerolineae bacterium]|nr:hypothetical protein [Anaerolineae bacterium]
MNSTILIVLLLVVGGMFGALLVFLVDWRYWERRVQKLRGERNKAQAANQVTLSRLQRAEKGQLIAQRDVENLRQDVAERDERLAQLHNENQQVCQQVAVMEVELTHLRADLAEAQGWEERADALKTENEALVGQLNRAEIQMSELQVQVDTAARQLTDAQILGKKLVEMQARLKEAEKQTATLQEKMTAVQHTFDYTGKNQLQLIRGIGPAYARRLNEAGVLTLEDLAKCAPEQITEIVQPKKWQHVEPEEWIREAKALTMKISPP